MKCLNCGFETTADFKFCENCGAPAPDSASTLGDACSDGTENKLMSVLKDNLFFIICILFSVSSVASIVNGGIPVFNILFTIFFWLTYAQAKKGISDAKYLRCVSGTVYANYVVNNVVAIILIVCGIIVTIAFELLAGSANYIGSFFAELGLILPDFGALSQFFIAILGLCIILGGVIILVINLLGMRKLHLFAQSVYKSVSQESKEKVDAAKVKSWLIFFAVLESISSLSSLTTNFFDAVSSGCLAAIIILAIVLINKYFDEQK